METGIMKNNYSIILILSVFSFFMVWPQLYPAAPAGAADMAGVKIMEKEVIGKYLADSKGITVYRFAKDGKNISNCVEGCAVNWPPFYAGPVPGGRNFDPNDFATITRTDGRPQTTYKGMPLYYFKNDKYPGDTFGDGLGDQWFLVTP
jgi:predicted lipoprotein with Yx(FWY)xxD motif